MKLKMTDQVNASIAATKADMEEAMKDPALRAEVDAVKAQYAAMELVERVLRSAKRKIDAFRRSYHKDFVVSVAIDDEAYRPVEFSSRELAFA